MPYSVLLTSHRRFSDVRSGAPDRLTVQELRACLELLARSRPTQQAQRPDGSIWVFRAGEPSAVAPLLWAGVRPNNGPQAGTIHLAVGGAGPFFLANMFEALSIAALAHEELGLHAFEATHGKEVTVESLRQLTDVQGEYSREQARLWQQRRERLHTAILMPLEFPAGQYDEGPNLLALRLKHPKPPPLEQLLAEPPEGQEVEIHGQQGVWFDRASNEPVTWFLLNPSTPDELLIWPQWKDEPFARTAHAIFEVAVRLRARVGGQVLWNGEPVTPDRTAWLQHYPELLAVELLQLVTLGWEPVTRKV